MSAVDSAALLLEARQALAAGDAGRCERLCRSLLHEAGPEPLRLLALALHQQKRSAEAALHQRRAAAASGEAGDYFALGVMELASGPGEAVLTAWGEAARRDPRHPHASRNLALALAKAGRYGEAAAVLEAAEGHFPGDPFFPRLLADAHAGMGCADLARADYARALALNPADARTWFLAGLVDRDQGRFADALACFGRAVAADSDFAAAHVDLAQMRLLLGDFSGGWPEWEWRDSNRWRGRPFSLAPPRPLAVHAEQGHGDTVQFCRYLPVLAARGFTVTLVCGEPLAGLMRTLPGPLRVATAPGPEAPGEEIGLLSLPLHLGPGPETGAPVPYLMAPSRPVAARVQRRGRLAAGLVWAGNPEHRNDRNRSCPLAALEPLSRLEGVDWYSLQVGAAATPPSWMTDLAPDLRDFSDTAAAIMALDLVIAVDTAVAHLAGALGRPVWLLLPWVPDWRWLLEGSDSPWYPTMTLFRQRAAGDWAECLMRVAAALALWKPPSPAP